MVLVEVLRCAEKNLRSHEYEIFLIFCPTQKLHANWRTRPGSIWQFPNGCSGDLPGYVWDCAVTIWTCWKVQELVGGLVFSSTQNQNFKVQNRPKYKSVSPKWCKVDSFRQHFSRFAKPDPERGALKRGFIGSQLTLDVTEPQMDVPLTSNADIRNRCRASTQRSLLLALFTATSLCGLTLAESFCWWLGWIVLE
jgi:hypothetical protein